MRFVVKMLISFLFLVVIAFFFWQTSVKVTGPPLPEQVPVRKVAGPIHTDDEFSRGKRAADASQKHWRTFLSLTSKGSEDPEAARQALTQFVTSSYGQHPLADEWIELTLRMRLQRKSSLLETIRGLEIQIELLKSLGGNENAERIQTLQESLKMFNRTLKSVQEAGEDPQTLEVGFQFETPSPPKKPEGGKHE